MRKPNKCRISQKQTVAATETKTGCGKQLRCTLHKENWGRWFGYLPTPLVWVLGKGSSATVSNNGLFAAPS
jgi:hypothetical protein